MTAIPCVSKKSLHSQNKNANLFQGIFIYIWMAEGLFYHMTPTSLKICYAWVSIGRFCKGYENYVAHELAVQFGRGYGKPKVP